MLVNIDETFEQFKERERKDYTLHPNLVSGYSTPRQSWVVYAELGLKIKELELGLKDEEEANLMIELIREDCGAYYA